MKAVDRNMCLPESSKLAADVWLSDVFYQEVRFIYMKETWMNCAFGNMTDNQ